jgi:fibronectin type 3 domain-containing protein
MARMVKIQWDKHSDPDVAGYIIYRNDKEADTFTKIGKTEKTEFLDKDVSDGMKYYYTVSSFYYVRGVEIIGLSSQPVSAETKHRPKTPANVSAESGLARKIDLKWNKNEEKDIVEYWVYRGREDKLDRSPFSKVKVNTFTDTNLKDNTNYFYAVKAVDIDGLESDLSNTVSGVTKSLPKPPIGLEGQASQGKLYLKWKPNEERDTKGYNVYKKGWFKNTLLTTSDQNSCEIKMEEKMKSINLYVTAIDKDGLESELSEEINIIFQ